MLNSEKLELSHIVRAIPKDEIKNNSITKLWKKYAYEFEYHTFRKYLRGLRK